MKASVKNVANCQVSSMRDCMENVSHIVTSLPFYYTSIRKPNQDWSESLAGRIEPEQRVLNLKFQDVTIQLAAFFKKELSLCTFPEQMFLRAPVTACSERLYSNTSLLKTRKASESCFSNVTGVCLVTYGNWTSPKTFSETPLDNCL